MHDFGVSFAYGLDSKNHGKTSVLLGFLQSLGAWDRWLGHLGNCFGGCWLQENDFSWILGLCVDILAAGRCLKPFLGAPWLGAGWLAGGLGAQGEPRMGGNPQRCHPGALGGLGAVARGNLKISFPGTLRL